jgi:hypothetical protein
MISEEKLEVIPGSAHKIFAYNSERLAKKVADTIEELI